MTAAITFRPITPEDIPLLHHWRNLPHVAQWWTPPHPSHADVQAEYTAYMRPNDGVRAYIVVIGGRDVGYIQAWQVAMFPDYKPYVPLTDETVGIDVFIGEPDYLHKGWGVQIIRQFICAHVFSDPSVPACIIDPLPENTAAIRAYEKAGFRHEKTFTHEGTGVYFMRLPRTALDCPGQTG